MDLMAAGTLRADMESAPTRSTVGAGHARPAAVRHCSVTGLVVGRTCPAPTGEARINMEIERKWMVVGWPEGLEQTEVYKMDQGYISVRPTVRIRREALQGGRTALVLCFKGAGGLSREEIETEINAELFAKLEHLIGKPLIHKERRGYRLPGGLTLEVNCVDPDLPTAFWYAEVEYETEAQALAWDPAACGLADYLHDECTGKPGSSMGEYWLKTRG